MALEAASFINDLVTANPVGGTDTKAFGDDHLRLIKTVLKASLPGMTGARQFEDTTAGAGTVNFLKFYRNITGVDGNVLGQLDFDGKDAANNQTTFLRLIARIKTAANGTEASEALLQLQLAGALATILTLPLLHDEPFQIPVPVNGTVRLMTKVAFPFTLLETTTICTSGTITATFQKNGVNIGGSANAISVAEQSQAHTDAFAAGDDVSVVFSANAACLNCSMNLKIQRTG